VQGARTFFFFLTSKCEAVNDRGSANLGTRSRRCSALVHRAVTMSVNRVRQVMARECVTHRLLYPAALEDVHREYRDHLYGLVVRVPGYTMEMYCVSCELRTEFIYVM
jgi:hypothetical protein